MKQMTYASTFNCLSIWVKVLSWREDTHFSNNLIFSALILTKMIEAVAANSPDKILVRGQSSELML